MEAVLLLNPILDTVKSEVKNMLTHQDRHKHLVFGGKAAENSGDWVLQDGAFSFLDLIDLCKDPDVSTALTSMGSRPCLTVSCASEGDFKGMSCATKSLEQQIEIQLNPKQDDCDIESTEDFGCYLIDTTNLETPFNLLEPAKASGFLKISKPSLYVFPAGKGDAAFFAVNGFNILVNGGSSRKACFWKLVRHLDRIDAVMMTHAGTDSLPGMNSFLQRKVAERDLGEPSPGTDEYNDWFSKVKSPELGVFYFNAPDKTKANNGDSMVLTSRDLGCDTLENLKLLDIKPHHCMRTDSKSEPLTLFNKKKVTEKVEEKPTLKAKPKPAAPKKKSKPKEKKKTTKKDVGAAIVATGAIAAATGATVVAMAADEAAAAPPEPTQPKQEPAFTPPEDLTAEFEKQRTERGS
ncbi:Microtubule-associated protein 1A [Branchiostoma belcheri]|nr:Microtubule-associated protein 1A [Branchiostoma belcheri]